MAVSVNIKLYLSLKKIECVKYYIIVDMHSIHDDAINSLVSLFSSIKIYLHLKATCLSRVKSTRLEYSKEIIRFYSNLIFEI